MDSTGLNLWGRNLYTKNVEKREWGNFAKKIETSQMQSKLKITEDISVLDTLYLNVSSVIFPLFLPAWP